MFFAGVVTTPKNKTRLHLFESKKITNLPNNKAIGPQLHTTNPNPRFCVIWASECFREKNAQNKLKLVAFGLTIFSVGSFQFPIWPRDKAARIQTLLLRFKTGDS